MNNNAIIFIILMTIFLSTLKSSSGQFPRQCTDETALRLRRCCPVAEDGSICGENSKRGFCVSLSSQLNISPINKVYQRNHHALIEPLSK